MSLPVDKPSYGNLDGLKVVYSAVEIAVPTACEIMSEWGADITWIENTYSGDSVRDTEFVKEMERRNHAKAELLYTYLDQSKFYRNYVAKENRSIMNVTFTTDNDELNAKFVAEATAAGLQALKGHKVLGGMRASIYNAMPLEGVQALIAFMKKFEAENAE